MTDEEITKMCKSLARRYKNYNEYEDLFQEGALAIYEHLNKEPNALPARLYRVASTRMHDYINLDKLPVTVPASDVARTLARDPEAEIESTWTPQAVEHLRLMLLGDVVSEDKANLTAPSSEDLYMKREQNSLLAQRIQEVMTADDQLLIFMRFAEGMSQAECGEFMGKSRWWVYDREKSIMGKIKTIVADLQHPGFF